jgi:hypothetical protein
MEPKPVDHSRQPSYPTRREVLAGAASFALVGLTGSNFLFADSETGKISVAPIFEHGEGRGATGCVVISPPVFLSEEEGMQILREELAKYKIDLKTGNNLDGVTVPSWFEEYKMLEKESGEKVLEETIVESPNHAKPLKLSGMDTEKRIAVEFVAEENYYDLGGAMSSSMVSDYNFKTVAKQLIALAQKQGKGQIFLGVFYDPLEKSGKKNSKKLLHEQAKDFIDWLKKQKAIDS